ncbi:MAG: alpha-glucan family phosphorylase [Clostridia bacterium]|nr:alpha-glucan family phosphorylase [Clostridia bacterium]
MYVFNRITVIPQLPKRINKLSDIANNLWWSWNTEFLKLFKMIDLDLWESIDKNPTKFLKLVNQEKIEKAAEDTDFLKLYDKIASDYENYMNSTDTWYNKQYPNNKKDLIAYFSAEYGLDEILPIYSGGLGILSGDHLKAASDLGIPLVACGLLYKNGYFNQKINGYGNQESEYYNIDLYNLPINPVKNEDGEELILRVPMLKSTLYLKVWQINVGRVKLYLMDSDIDLNIEEYKNITLRLYGGDKEMRIRQEIVLGMAGVVLFKALGYEPTVYHMNEGHSAFLTLELIKEIMKEKQVSFDIAKEIVTSRTVFTTHTPVPAGNDIFEIPLVDKYFDGIWEEFGIDRETFLRLGMKENAILEPGFNMAILALKIAGKKNGVSKLHGAVSRELFAEVWPDIAANESPITHVTNGIHTCTWLAPNIKELYNEYLMPYWQDNIQDDRTWDKIDSIPDQKLWKEHIKRKGKLIKLVKQNITNRYKRSGYTYEQINELVSKLNPDALTIGFARRFATYKRGTLIFRDIERLTQILNDPKRPVQLIFAGKAHPADSEGQDLIRQIHEISLMPQFKGKIFILENYNIGIARYLVSGVDVWLNNPRRPMEASGTSGQKASVNGVVNFSILDGWWAEGYDGKNGWAIGTHEEYDSYEIQDNADSNSIYNILENKIIPAYYNKEDNGVSKDWMKIMKNSIMSTGGKYSTSRMLVDYVEKLYMPLCNLYDNSFKDLDNVMQFFKWKKAAKERWNEIEITQDENVNDVQLTAGDVIEVKCNVKLPNFNPDNVSVQVYYGQISDNGIVNNVYITEMKRKEENEEKDKYEYSAKIKLMNGGNFGYTFRVMPKHDMLLDSENLNLVKWMTK